MAKSNKFCRDCESKHCSCNGSENKIRRRSNRKSESNQDWSDYAQQDPMQYEDINSL